jgi:hypothetical protein
MDAPISPRAARSRNGGSGFRDSQGIRASGALRRINACWRSIFEDLAWLRSGNGPANMAMVRHTALNLLSRAKPVTSFKNRRKKAGWSVDYLETVIRQTA